MTAEKQIARLEEQLTHVLELLRLKDEQLRVVQARTEELEKQKTPPAPFVKAHVVKPKAEPNMQCKKRAAKHSHGRRRLAPTRTVEYLIKHCMASF